MLEQELEQALIGKLTELKYTHRPDIRDRAALEDNFRNHFQALNRVQLTDGEFKRLLDEIVTPTSSAPRTCSARSTASPATTAPRSTTPSSTSRTGAKTPSRSSTSSASIPTTAGNATTLCY
jgi:hypothetical protein